MYTPETEGRNGAAIPTCWAERFQPHVLQRGFDYYLSGRVAGLRVDDSAWRARVTGRVPYAVTVPFEATGGAASCSCPHYADGYECKHIAAVCYAIQDARLGLAPLGVNWETATHDVGDIQELVNRLGVHDLQKIVCDLVAHDRALGRRIELEYGSASAEVAFADLRADLLSLAVYDVEEFSRATDDWETQCDADALVEATLRPLFDGGRWRECVDITIWLQDFLLSFGLGEGIQVAAGAMSACLDWWRRIADALSEREDSVALRDDACRRMAKALRANRGAISDLADDCSIERAVGSLTRATGDAKTLDLLLAVVDDFIEQHSRTLLQVGGRSLEGYGTSRWVRLRLDLL